MKAYFMPLFRLTIASFLVIVFLLSPFVAFAQTQEELEAELRNLEAIIIQYEVELQQSKTKKQTLSNKIAQLKKEQAKLKTQIKSTNLKITDLNKKLQTTEDSIGEKKVKIATLQNYIASLLRTLEEKQRKSWMEILFIAPNFTSFMDELYSLETLSFEVNHGLLELKNARAELEKQYSKFNDQQEDVKNQLAIHTLENKKLTAKVNEQDKLFKETKGNEARYQVLLADSRKRASEIKSRIYELLGVTVQITFGEAANIAKWASGPTNIRPAFLLAILTQESNLGKNVGTCNRIGDPKDKNWRAVMKPDRDQQAFLTITAELGKNPELTPVSCPRKDAKGNNLGWGGAMGPAQFIPSTWLRYKDKVTAITGKIANPWDIRDAFLAAALLLKDNGASSRDKQAEWKAAMRYFSGSTDPKNRFYGDNVQDLAAQYEEDLKTLGG